MANDYTTDLIALDTFTAAIALSTLRAAHTKNQLYGFAIDSIEWQTPTTPGHTALITEGVGGRGIFSETCVTANDSIIKNYFGKRFSNINIAINGVDSGKIVIQLAGGGKK